jgi:SAM-dependent methyltransferase
MTNPMHSANQHRWELGAAQWGKRADTRGLWQRCPTEPELVFCPKLLERLSRIAGKRVCVLGSGDNQAVFALAGLGALVTSVDISQPQLDIAANRAQQLGLTITFTQADVTDLSAIPDATFDIVYTGGHVAVWVSDLQTYYREAARTLAPGGLFIVDEYHPFRRIWKDSTDRLEIGTDYYHRGPHEFELDDDILAPGKGDLNTYEFNWTIADYINAMLLAGCTLQEVHEHGQDAESWEGAPLQGLPANLLLIAQKTRET